MGMTVQELIETRKEIENIEAGRNSMGCSENWYNPIYSVTEAFNREQLEKMSEEEIDRLLHLAQVIADGLY